jgi:hypothetical protein
MDRENQDIERLNDLPVYVHLASPSKESCSRDQAKKKLIHELGLEG